MGNTILLSERIIRDQIRTVEIIPGFLSHLKSSSLIKMGNTHVLCTAIMEDRVPPFLKNTGKGWVTAEYGMLPLSSPNRIDREAVKGKQTGRTHEIQRLIGRSMRAVVDMNSFGEKTIKIDCDVIQADGGTRCASITGAFVALYELFRQMQENGEIDDKKASPIKDFVAAISVGIVNNNFLLDINYEEDSTADVDVNLVMTGSGKVIEIQGTSEGEPFSLDDLDELIRLGSAGIKQLIEIQKQSLAL
ncbi:MAG: ribonuclease PH [bacterium]|nr:ribonuclease PH [bacterium]